MFGRITHAPGVEFIAPCCLTSQQIGISAVLTGGTNRFMLINHKAVGSHFFNHALVVIYHPLAVVFFTPWYNPTHISCFHSIVAVVFHKFNGFVNAAFVVGSRGRSFVVHDQFHPFGGCVGLKSFHIKIGIRSNEIKNLFFPVARPVFPTDIPAFDQHTLNAVGSSKINVSFNIFGSSTMFTVGFQGVPVGRFEFQIGRIGVVPGPVIGHVHAPPDTDKFLWFNKIRIFYFAGFIQIHDCFRSQYISCFIADNDCAPRRVVWCLHIHFCAGSIGNKS